MIFPTLPDTTHNSHMASVHFVIVRAPNAEPLLLTFYLSRAEAVDYVTKKSGCAAANESGEWVGPHATWRIVEKKAGVHLESGTEMICVFL